MSKTGQLDRVFGQSSAAPPQTPPGRIALRVAEASALELDPRPAQILNFGSQLLHGTVGLPASRRVTEAAGVRTIDIPTVLLSVIPHFDAVHHLDVPAEWIARALRDLDGAGALRELRLVTSGYLASPAQTAAVAAAVRSADSEIPLLLDPTLGDTELGFYTDPALVGALRSELVPLATGLTPNLFELAHLSGAPLDSLTSPTPIARAARSLITARTQWVVVTGVRSPVTTSVGEVIVTATEHCAHWHAPLRTSAKGLGDTFTAALAVELSAMMPAVFPDLSHLAAAVDVAAETVRRATAHPYPLS
ncbi:Pyridoxal kinase [Leucobacter sp. 7(1)]|uniref:bifunctional hydroxymethylpyrimidine kinase/phosphomethylpyrimidine kinase n=1 Tax=Leucobacter sp. 7(1) TaxID=1255613 RepID=UPI00097ECD6B|nr:PfkB family carbohydrate kinase [Leucobacter sp. 7(1)]SJN08037.1 Pyridoxal kinase [Leucobacter sp. 7(1)]